VSRTVSHCVDKPLGVVDEYVFTSSEQLNEDITAADVLLECRRDTLKTLQLHYAPLHKSEVVRLEGEARQARISLDNARRAFATEQAYHSMLVDSDSGRRPRCEHELELLQSLNDKIAGLCRVAKRRRVAVAGEQKLLDVHLEIVRNELRSQRVVEIRRGIMEGQARLAQLESEVTRLKARHEELAARVAVVVAPGVLLSDASSYVSASDAQLASLQRVRAAFLETIAEKRAEAVRRKQRREQHTIWRSRVSSWVTWLFIRSTPLWMLFLFVFRVLRGRGLTIDSFYVSGIWWEMMVLRLRYLVVSRRRRLEAMMSAWTMKVLVNQMAVPRR
jgi:hypothetical protein